MMEKFHYTLDGRDIALPYSSKISLKAFVLLSEAEEVFNTKPHEAVKVFVQYVVSEADREYFLENIRVEEFGSLFQTWAQSTPAAANLPE